MIRIDSRSLVVFLAAAITSLGCVGALRMAYSAEQAQDPVLVVPLTANPASPMAQPAVLRAADGHYWAEAAVEGRKMRMLVDTGASLVTLGRKDARTLGVTPHDSEFSQTLMTAAGPVRAAPVILSHVSIAGVRLNDVEAVVVDRELPAPLLGMSFLGRLSAFEARPDGIVLKG
ncbi:MULTISPECIES: retropepsin-like aspartic protease family protein [unclassified Brevundimonas]|uniref:retropepsin-like aspartic protease family protein n=1 Tax=unclassified Brevundimonas TaxID=2622653 RepID=UPI0025C315BD|nr:MULTISPECIES: TIGR02281 family clan AA aspartic protease [unclassified Brevundimonas]